MRATAIGRRRVAGYSPTLKATIEDSPLARFSGGGNRFTCSCVVNSTPDSAREQGTKVLV
jgi:hypothetical protein